MILDYEAELRHKCGVAGGLQELTPRSIEQAITVLIDELVRLDAANEDLKDEIRRINLGDDYNEH